MNFPFLLHLLKWMAIPAGIAIVFLPYSILFAVYAVAVYLAVVWVFFPDASKE